MTTSPRFNLSDFVKRPSISDALSNSQITFVKNNVTGHYSVDQIEISKNIRLIVTLVNFVLLKDDEELEDEDFDIINNAFYLIRSININDNECAKLFEDFFNIESVQGSCIYYFVLGALGLLSDNNIKVRIDLDNFTFLPKVDDNNWKERLINDCVVSLILLIRKKDGLHDVDIALGIIDRLKHLQKRYEEEYLNDIPYDRQLKEAFLLLSFYHMGKMLTEVSDYLRTGYLYNKDINRIILVHYKSALDSIENADSSDLIVKIFKVCLTKIYRNSLWFNTIGLGSKIEILCNKLAKENILELLPSQQEAIASNLLDTASNVTVVQMPTSAGKSLLAEFKILQNLALNPNAKTLYIVPNRALVSQVLHDLREDLSELDIVIEKTSRSNDIDPMEDVLLQERIHILVTTPEKADLLIRKSHPSIMDASLIVVDEAHTIKDGGRGARLELLLAIIKRELPRARFLLLSPFIPNAQVLTDWLATGRNAVRPINVSWKPADKVFIGLKESKNFFHMTLLPSAHSLKLLTSETELKVSNIYEIQSTATKERLLEFTAKHFSKEKSAVLYLCRGKKTADNMALTMEQYINKKQSGDLSLLVSKYIEDEAGCETALSKSLKKRIAIHHSGLTDDTKSLVEFLIRKREIDHVCATTTVANGMNFPISVVYFDDYRKGKHDSLSINDFLNITGRAGRTLVDNVGKIIFPFNSTTNIGIAKGYIQQEVNEVTSALSNLILQSDKIIKSFTNKDDSSARGDLFYNNEELSVLVQYLVHLLSVSNATAYLDELENIFKDSYGYYSLKTEEQRSNFVNLCKAIYFNLDKSISKGALSFADKTGFSVPSVIQIMKSKKDDPDIYSKESWELKNIFDKKSGSLASKIKVIAALREVQIGTDSSQAPFNPKPVADVLIGWVNGEKLDPLSKLHPFFKAKSSGDRMNDFTNYLTSATFKSSWGLSVLEAIGKSNDSTLDEGSYIPSMIYYGVQSPEAVTMRMIGAPRSIANNLASLVINSGDKDTLSSLRKKIYSLKNSDWDGIVPRNSTLNGEEWKEVTKVLIA